MTWLKSLIIELAGFWNLEQLARAMRSGDNRPLQTQPDWLIGWVIRSGYRETSSRPWKMLFIEAVRERRLRVK